jgi:hypothetical protein
MPFFHPAYLSVASIVKYLFRANEHLPSLPRRQKKSVCLDKDSYSDIYLPDGSGDGVGVGVCGGGGISH